MKTRVYLLYVVIVTVVIGAFSLPIIIMRITNPIREGPDLLIPDTGAGSATPTEARRVSRQPPAS